MDAVAARARPPRNFHAAPLRDEPCEDVLVWILRAAGRGLTEDELSLACEMLHEWQTTTALFELFLDGAVVPCEPLPRRDTGMPDPARVQWNPAAARDGQTAAP